MSAKICHADGGFGISDTMFTASFGADRQSDQSQPPGDSVALLQCPDCSRPCKGSGGLAAHRKRSHGICMQARLYVADSRCLACRIDFRPRPRPLHHLQFSSSACKKAMQTVLLVLLPKNVVADADEKDRGLAKETSKRGETRTRALLPPTPS